MTWGPLFRGHMAAAPVGSENLGERQSTTGSFKAAKVLLVEADPVLLLRLIASLGRKSAVALLGAVTTLPAATALLDVEEPDVILMDFAQPALDAVHFVRQAAVQWPRCKVLLFNASEGDPHALRCLDAGAAACLCGNASDEQILCAIAELHAEGAVSAFTPARAPGREDPASPLSGRETEIIRIVAKGLSFDAIAVVLGISPHTVVTHTKKIYRKLAVHSRGEAVFEAGQLGLLK